MRRLFFMFLVALTLVACSKEETTKPSAIIISNQEQLTQTVYANDNTGKSDVTFSTNGAWTSELTESIGVKSTPAVADWLSITPTSGDKAGNYTISISLHTNYTGEKRTANIMIKSGGESVKISISQEALTVDGEKPQLDPKPSGTGVLKNETTKASVNLTGVKHSVDGPDVIRITFVGEGENGVEYMADFYNPLQNGKLKGGVYTIKDINTPPYPEMKNGDCGWYKSDIAGYGESGTIKVEQSNDTYVFTFDIQTGEGNQNYKLTGSFTGVPKYINKEVKVQSITLNETQKTLEMGATLSLTATIFPESATDKRYVWSSSDTTVATVTDKGLVKSVKAGNATITATTKEGGKTATCAVTVKPAVAVTGITVEPTEVTLLEGDYHEFFAENCVKVLPENAFNKNYTWKSSNDNIASYTGKGIEAKSAGEVTITFTTQEGEKTAKLKVIVNKRQTSGSGTITRIDPNGKYENLVHSIIRVDHTILSKNGVELSFVNTLGNVVGKFKFNNPLANGRLSTGTYSCVYPDNGASNSFSNIDGEWGNSRQGSITVGITDSKYTITINVTSTGNGFTFSGSYTGSLTYTNEYVDVSGVQLNETTKSLVIGKSLELTATVLPANAFNKKVTWSSSEPSVASIYVSQNGICNVSALKVGTATITATTEDGAKTATCVVTVQSIPTTGSGTFSNNKSQSLNVNRASQQVNEKEPKEIEIGFYKENSVYDDLRLTLVRTNNDTGALKAGTYTTIQGILVDSLGVKFSSKNTGSVTVSINGQKCTITLDITTEDGTKISGTYTGEVPTK